MKLASFIKAPLERKRYALDYSNWLDGSETVISTVTFVVTPTVNGGLVVDAYSVSPATKVVFFVSGGVVNAKYVVLVRITTSAGQVKEDTVEYIIKAS